MVASPLHQGPVDGIELLRSAEDGFSIVGKAARRFASVKTNSGDFLLTSRLGMQMQSLQPHRHVAALSRWPRRDLSCHPCVRQRGGAESRQKEALDVGRHYVYFNNLSYI
jgi:hypothetical protein